MPRKGVLEVVVEVLDSGRSPEDVCGNDTELLAAVKQRLKRHEQINTQLDDLFPTSPQGRSKAPGFNQERLPQIPGYDIDTILGRGGIGVVYDAMHLRLGRRVALKMLLAGDFATGNEMRRFEREAKSIAALRHPHIVQIFDFGEHEGRPFFTMELLEGGTLSDKLGGKALPLLEAAETVATLASAVEAAHRAGIVHRDLKPANVLLTPGGLVKISDFGVAFQAEDLSITKIGEAVGTPSYMAPEQAAGRADANTPAVDIHALGTVLYETLTGRPPFRGTTAAETQQRVIDDLPLPPSRLQAGVPKDLDTICGKCLEKNPHRRYASAADLAADLRRFLNHEPIKARPLSWPGQAIRWRRRHPGVAAAITSLLALIGVMVGGSLIATAYFRTLERQQTKLATEKSQLAEANDVARAVAVHAQQSEMTLRQQAEDKSHQLRRTLYFAQMNLGGQAAASPSGLGRVHQWLTAWEGSSPDLRNWEWFYLDSLCHHDLRTLRGHTAGVCDVVRNPAGDRLASAGADGLVMIWNPATGERLMTLEGHARDVVVIAWSADGKKLASASSDGTVIIWDAQTGATMRTLPGTPNSVLTLAWNSAGDRLASAGTGRAITIWDTERGLNLAGIGDAPQGVRTVAWSPDGKRLASGGPDFNVYLWNPTTGTRLATFHGHVNFVTDLAWSPDGSRIASASNDSSVKIWDSQSGAVVQSLKGHAMGVTRVVWSPDAQCLATSSADQTVKVWSAESGKPICTYRGHTMPATAVAWNADGTITSSSFDSTIKVWTVPATEEVIALQPDIDGPRAAAWSHDGKWLAATDGNSAVTIWNPRTRERRTILAGATKELNAIAWSPDDARLAAAGDDRTVRVWQVESGKILAALPTGGFVRALAWSQDNRLASGGDDAVVRIWDWEHGREATRFVGHSDAVRTLCWSADSAMLASGSIDTTIKIWDARTGTLSGTLAGHSAAVTSVAWSSDLHRLASGSEDQTIRVWDPPAGQVLATLVGHTTTVGSVAWSPDNTRLASASEDRTIKVWDPVAGNVALSLSTDDSIPAVVAWSPDGMQLATAGDHHLLRIYDAGAGYSAAKATQYLGRLAALVQQDPKDAAAWKSQTSIYAHHQQWTEAARAADRYLAMQTKPSFVVEGFWIAGPFPDTADASDAPEADTDPSHPAAVAADRAGNGPLVWQASPFDESNFVNIAPLFRHERRYSAYAQLRIYSPKAQRVSAVIDRQPPMRMWLNGRSVYDPSRPFTEHGSDAAAVAIALRQGWNTLLTRVPGTNDSCALRLNIQTDTARAKASPHHAASSSKGDS